MPDITIPEGFGFLVLYGLPHLALARAAMLLGLLFVMPASVGVPLQPTSLRTLLAALLFNIVGLCVPFYLAVIYVILGVWGLAAWILQRRFPIRLFWRAVIAAGLTLPLFAYNAWIFTLNPAFRQWSAQNILQSPPIWEYVFAYLPIVLCAVIALRFFARRAKTRIEDALLIGWMIAVPILVYLPINVQRRLAEGVIVPLAILAAWGIRQLVWWDQADPGIGRGGSQTRPYTDNSIADGSQPTKVTRRGLRTLMTLGIITFLCATSILWVATGALASVLRNPPTYIQGEQIRALAWLQANAEPGDRVLSAWATGNMLPAYTDLRPYIGLGPETLNAEIKRYQTIAYFGGRMNADQREALHTSPCTPVWYTSYQTAPQVPLLYQMPPGCRIRYVFWGVNERALVADAEPSIDLAAAEAAWSQGLTLVYDDAEGHTRIYAVPEGATP
ncbi:MAG: hypothetical protein U0670_02445 [Anaerolineae bacterium]